MTIARPSGMPVSLDNCWGKKYQDGDRECEQCRFNDTCRPKMFEYLASVPVRSPPPQSLPIYGANRTTGTVPMPPPKPSTPPPMTYPPAPVHVRNYSPSVTPPPSPPQQAPVHNYPYSNQQGYQGYAIPDPDRPNPYAPMFRPGAQGPAYYFNQYEGEGTGTRLMKNVFLRALEAMFAEAARFFGNWTMPPRR
jgi:hypothetical protein